MSFPLVVLMAVLPGLYALKNWDLDPPGPWWGLRALAVVLDGLPWDQEPAAAALRPGAEAEAFRAVAYQPPLYAWAAATGLGLSPSHDPRGAVLPSYMAGAAVVMLAYLHGRLWRGPRTALVAAVLTAFNRNLLVHMQQATPTTLGLLGVLVVLYGYGRYLRAGPGTARPWGAGGAATWTSLGGLALGLSLLSVGGFGLVALPVVWLHRAYLRAGAPPGERERSGPWWAAWRDRPGVAAAAAALAIALAVAGPWHAAMLSAHGGAFLAALAAPPNPPGAERMDLLTRLIDLAPAALPLGIYGIARAVRRALTAEDDARDAVGGAFWVVWLAVAAIAPALWPSGPRPALGLFVLVPLNLLTAQAITDLASRRAPIRDLSYLAPASAVSVAWWASANLRNAVSDLSHGRADSATALGLHLGLDLLVAGMVATKFLDRWARRRDDRQRAVLGGFLAAVAVVTIASGIREVRFRHTETREPLLLREVILRLHHARPFDLLAVIGPDANRLSAEGPAPGGRVDFVLRSALPRVPRRDLRDASALVGMPDCRRLVILVGTQKFPYRLQAELGLEAIYPGVPGTLEAYATADRPRDGATAAAAITPVGLRGN